MNYLQIPRKASHLLILLSCALAGDVGITLFGIPPSWAQSTINPLSQPTNRLKSGDRIRLVVAGFPDLSGEQIIMSDGSLQFPLAGTVAIAGQTPSEAVTTITEALRPYIRRPQVGLAVVSIRAPRISIMGEVLRPGPRVLGSTESQSSNGITPAIGGENFQTLSNALVEAGGITPNADIRNITIRRLNFNPTSLENKGGKTEIKVNLWETIQMGDLASDPPLVDGDEITVPAAQLSATDQQQILTSTIAPSQITVQVAGQVRSPGSVKIAPSEGVSGAIAAAGGLTNNAKQKLTLLRMASNGKLERKIFTFGEQSDPLRAGDVIVASRSKLSSVLDTFGSLFSPISSFIYLLR
jgi:polysaccharide export outer membrane protein